MLLLAQRLGVEINEEQAEELMDKLDFDEIEDSSLNAQPDYEPQEHENDTEEYDDEENFEDDFEEDEDLQYQVDAELEEIQNQLKENKVFKKIQRTYKNEKLNKDKKESKKEIVITNKSKINVDSELGM